jgi:hypothetical protein
MWDIRNAYKMLVGKPERKGPLVPRRRLEGDIRMDHKKIGW